MVFKYYSHFKFVLLNILGILSSAESIVLAYIVGTLTNIATTGQFKELPKFLFFSLSALILTFIAQVSFNYFKTDAIKETNSTLRREVFAGMLNSSTNKNSKGLSFLTNEFKLLETNRFNAEISIIISTYTLVLALGYGLYVNWMITLIFLFGSMIPIIGSNVFQKPIQKASTKWTEANEEYVNQTKNFLAGTDTVKLYHGQQKAVEKNQASISKLEQALAKMNLLNLNAQTFVNVIANLFTFLTPFLVGIYLIIKGQTTLGALFSIVQLSNSFINPILIILGERNNLSTTKEIVKHVNEYLNLAKVSSAASSQDFDSLSINNLSLNHDDKMLAQHINLQLNPKEKVAVIGPSGAGKSTLLDYLLTGNFGNSDEILLNNQVVKAGTFSNLFGYSTQKPIIFADTLMYNLTLGENISQEIIDQVMADLDLTDLVTEKGYEYQLGDNADQLSGGQLARIELARAILSKRPVLLLDEVNASLDQHTSDIIHNYLLHSDLTFIEIIHHYQEGELNQYNQILDFKDYI